MGLTQNTTVDTSMLVLGNYTLRYGPIGCELASAISGYTNLGAGIVNNFAHNVTMIDVQAGNAPDPIEGVADEKFTVTGSLIEWNTSLLVSAWGGLLSAGTAVTATSSVSGYTTLTAGGANTLTPQGYLLTNRRIITDLSGGTSSALTYILIYNGTFRNGPQFTSKGDNDSDPINTVEFEIEAVNKASRAAGDQLYRVRKWVLT